MDGWLSALYVAVHVAIFCMIDSLLICLCAYLCGLCGCVPPVAARVSGRVGTYSSRESFVAIILPQQDFQSHNYWSKCRRALCQLLRKSASGTCQSP